MGIFDNLSSSVSSKVNELKGDLERTTAEAAPSVGVEMDKFFATLQGLDVLRTNLFFVRVERHVNLSTLSAEDNIAPDGGSLNGIMDNNLVSQGISALTFGFRGAAQNLLKETLGPYSTKIVKTGFGDYYNDIMGISKGSLNVSDFDPSKTVGLYAESVTIPSITQEVRAERMQYQKKNLIVVDKGHSDLSMTIRCSSDLSEYKYFRWLVDEKVNTKNNTMAFPDDYVIPAISVFIYNRESNAFATAIQTNCVITNISNLEFSYESNNEIAKFTVDFMPEQIEFETYTPQLNLDSLVSGFNGIRSLL